MRSQKPEARKLSAGSPIRRLFAKETFSKVRISPEASLDEESSPERHDFVRQLTFTNLRGLTQARFPQNSHKLESTEGSDRDQLKIKKTFRLIKRFQNATFYKRLSRWQKLLYVLLEDPGSSLLAKIVFFYLVLCIVFTLVQATIDSFHTNDERFAALYAMEWIVSISFTIELGLRWLCCTAFGMKRWVYMTRFLNIIDVMSLVPFYMNLNYSTEHRSFETLRILRILRFVRIVRVLKLSRYMRGTETFLTGLKSSVVASGFVLYFILVTVLLFAVGVYYAEMGSTFETINDRERDVESIIGSAWWAVVTMTTVGYGDVVPQTVIGKIIGGFAAFLGMLLFTFPTVIIGHNFQQALKNSNEAKRVERYKEQERRKNPDLTAEQREVHFMNHRIELIDKTNNTITKILSDSQKLYLDVAKNLKHLYRSIYAEDSGGVGFEKMVAGSSSTPASATNKMDRKIGIMEKLMKVRRKIKVANLFKGAAGGTSMGDSLEFISPPTRGRLSSKEFAFMSGENLPNPETMDAIEHAEDHEVNLIPVAAYEKDLLSMDKYPNAFKLYERKSKDEEEILIVNSLVDEKGLADEYNQELNMLTESVLQLVGGEGDVEIPLDLNDGATNRSVGRLSRSPITKYYKRMKKEHYIAKKEQLRSRQEIKLLDMADEIADLIESKANKKNPEGEEILEEILVTPRIEGSDSKLESSQKLSYSGRGMGETFGRLQMQLAKKYLLSESDVIEEESAQESCRLPAQ